MARKRTYDKQRRASIILNAATYEEIEAKLKDIPDPVTGRPPISFSRFMSLLADAYVEHTVKHVEDAGAK